MEPTPSFEDFLRYRAGLVVSPAQAALHALRVRDIINAQDDLADLAAEAAVEQRPKRAQYYEEWAVRIAS
jgi:hypothetical protein